MFGDSDIDALLAILRGVDPDVRLGGLTFESPRRSVRPGSDSAVTLRLAVSDAAGELLSQAHYRETQGMAVIIVQPQRTDMGQAERVGVGTAARIVASVQAAPIADWTLEGYDVSGLAYAVESDQWLQTILGLRFQR